MTMEDNFNHGINKEAAKISAISLGKIDKYHTDKVANIIIQTYSSLGKFIEKQTKKQVDALKSLNLSNKIDELNQIKTIFP